METDQQKLAYLERLGEELTRQGFTAKIVGSGAKSCLKAANAKTPTLNERIHAQQGRDGSWAYWWPWRQPIGGVDDLDTVTGKIAAVLRPVQGAS